jgi:UDP-glucose 4-epimerase
MQKILIIGGSGFIGTSIVQKLIKSSKIYILDIKKNKKFNYAKYKNIKFIRGDIFKSKTFDKIKIHFDIVYYLAAKTSSKVSEDYPSECFNTNINGTLNLFNWATIYKPKKIIFTSSMSVYGEFAENAKETDLCKPTSFYGISKLAGENILLKLKIKKIKIVIFRLFNVYGPGQNFNNLLQGMLSIYLAQAYTNKRIMVTGSLKRFRDFVFIDDVTEALTKKYKYNLKKDNIYNVGTGEKTYVHKLIKLIFNTLEIKQKVILKKGHSGDTWGTYSDNKKLLSLGWKNKISLKIGLNKTINDLKKIK